MDRYATVFETELYAILSVTRLETVLECREIIVFIWSDIQEPLENIVSFKKSPLMWVRGHYAIEGNEVADELARVAVNQSCQGPEPRDNRYQL